MKGCKRRCKDFPHRTKQDMGTGACHCRACKKYMPTPGNRRCKCCGGIVRTKTRVGHHSRKRDIIPYREARARVIA